MSTLYDEKTLEQGGPLDHLRIAHMGSEHSFKDALINPARPLVNWLLRVP